MIFARGARQDYDNWAHLGNAGWSWDDVLPLFRRMEDHDAGPSATRGAGGPLHILTRYQPDPVHKSILDAGAEIGLAHNPDHNSGNLDGIAAMEFTIKEGERHSTARAYLGPSLSHPGLTILTGAHARRLIMDGTRCTGVEWVRDGRVERGAAEVEVIVAGGAVESPRLLMLSGIGEPAHLRSFGIDVVAGLPGVGQNLHDHVLSPVILTAEREIGPPTPGLPACQTHLWWRSRPGLVAPDVQPLHFMLPMYSEDWMSGPDNGITLMAGMVRPASRGSIRLTGPTPEHELLIDPATFACESDLETLATAVTLCRELGATTALAEWGVRERYPGPGVSTQDELRDYVRRTAITYHHQIGTCRMGVDADAVVDPELRVHGVDGLRVADASVMPVATSANTNAPAVMIGERAADLVTV